MFLFQKDKELKKNLTILDVEETSRNKLDFEKNVNKEHFKSFPSQKDKNTQKGNYDIVLVKKKRDISSVDVNDFNQVSLSGLGIKSLKDLKFIQDLRADLKDLGREYKFISGGYYFYEEKSNRLSSVVWDSSKKRFAYFSGEVIIESSSDIKSDIEDLGLDIVSEPSKNKFIVSASQHDDQTLFDLLNKLKSLKSIKAISFDLSFSQDLRQ